MCFGARLFWRGIVIWLGFGPRTPRVFSPVAFSFRGSGVFSALSLSPSSSPPPLFWRPARVLFLPFLCVLLQDTGPTSGTWSGRSCIHVAMSALSPLSARVGRPPPLFLPPSAFSLSLSLSLLSLSASMRIEAFHSKTANGSLKQQCSSQCFNAHG